jgi:hypothetical protein
MFVTASVGLDRAQLHDASLVSEQASAMKLVRSRPKRATCVGTVLTSSVEVLSAVVVHKHTQLWT